MQVLLLTPPMTQLNTPYPATAYLTGFLRQRGFSVAQADPALSWVLSLLSKSGLSRVLDSGQGQGPALSHVRQHRTAITACIEPVIAFLQGKDPSLAHRIVSRRWLMEGKRFAQLGPNGHEEEYLQWAFGTMGLLDRARFFATLFVEDLADALREVDPHFDFARYGESLAASAASFDPLLDALSQKPVTSLLLDEITDALFAHHRPQVVGMTIPFPGNVLGGLRMAKRLREIDPTVRIVWGGGYVNTELRITREPRLFDYIDALTYDDGEEPFVRLLDHLSAKQGVERLFRTRLRGPDGVLVWHSDPEAHDVPFSKSATPTYEGLPIGDYLGLIDMLNPMHRLWSDTRWNKLTVAHGCYWKQCSFCDVTLDYIGRYDPLGADMLVDRIEALIAETGQRGFHFVDEAAPPAGLKAMAETLVRRQVATSWWGNIRFEKTFTPELCALLAESGCVAVSGGLEVASNRLLKLMKKGVTVEQVARVTKAFAQAGIKVHAYLMYGFPTQTEQETIDSLEMVRQLFQEGCIDSGFWHRFSATVHSPIGLTPQDYGIVLTPMPEPVFAQNDLDFDDPTGVDHDMLGRGLHKAVYNFMLGMGVDEDVRSWFERPVPKSKVSKRFIREALAALPAKVRGLKVLG